MNKAVVVLAVALAAAAAADAAACPTNETFVQNFNLTNFMGHWHEITVSKLAQTFFEHDCTCTEANYNLTSDPSKPVTVFNTCNIGSPTGRLQKILGSAKVLDPSNPAKLGVTFGGPYAPYYIIDGDDGFNDYAVAWCCQDILGLEFPVLWVLARKPTMPADQLAQILARAQANTGYDTSSKNMVMTVNDGCTWSN